jgi:hypothetical protein
MSQMLFINTEAGFGTAGGNQFDKFKININDSPFTLTDAQQLKLTLRQFQAERNWYDINETNNSFRIYVPDDSTDTIFEGFDEIYSIPKGNYSSRESLATAFGTMITLAYSDHKNVASVSLEINCTMTHTEPLQLNLTIIGDGNWTNQMPIIQSLQIPETINTPYTINEQFNDSYLLMGFSRLETYETIPVTNSTKTAMASTKELQIFGFFPMNNSPNTLPYLYLSCEVARNQCTTNMKTIEKEHEHSTRFSTILAKIPRVESNNQVQYILDGLNLYSCLVDTRMLNHIVFSITDHRGRMLSSTLDDQKTSGNMMCNLAIEAETLTIPFPPNLLVGTPPFMTTPVKGYIPTLGFGNLNTY